ncbi:hypothetical protein JB92DRAFT_2832665 [Gautieria morchelliformis]|nr:hypothetical protein JB92DRAFT_2832665 [Gautieria morchelliformis]
MAMGHDGKTVHPAYIKNKAARHPQHVYTSELLFALAKYKERYEDTIVVALEITPESDLGAGGISIELIQNKNMQWNEPRAFHRMPQVQELLAKFRATLSLELLEYQQQFPSRAGLPPDRVLTSAVQFTAAPESPMTHQRRHREVNVHVHVGSNLSGSNSTNFSVASEEDDGDTMVATVNDRGVCGSTTYRIVPLLWNKYTTIKLCQVSQYLLVKQVMLNMPCPHNVGHVTQVYSKWTYFLQRMHRKAARSRARKRCMNIPQHDRCAAAKRTELRKKLIWDDIVAEWCRQEDNACILARKHNKSGHWMMRHIQRVSCYGSHKRKVHPWNAFIHAQSLEINEDLPAGEKACLHELQALVKNTLNWRSIPQEDMDAMIHCLEEWCLLRKTGSRLQPSALAQDVRLTTQRVQEELTTLGARCHTSSMAVTVRTSPAYGNPPIYSIDSTSRAFVEIVLGMEFEELCLKYEAFAMCGLQGVAKNDNVHHCMLKRRVRMLGWPSVDFNPGHMSTKELDTLLKAWADGTCHWRKVLPDELEERQQTIAQKKASREINARPRKKRSDAGKKRKPYCKTRGKMRSANTSSSGSDSDHSSEGNRSNKASKKCRMGKHQPVSREIIDDSD